jgi:Arc/MetJ-type ribon-helix-helix transcriptional regulator
MQRTTISLPDDLAAALRREARRRHASASEVAREALMGYLGMKPDEPRKLPFAALGRSGGGTIAANIEELIAEEWNDDLLGR